MARVGRAFYADGSSALHGGWGLQCRRVVGAPWGMGFALPTGRRRSMAANGGFDQEKWMVWFYLILAFYDKNHNYWGELERF